MNSKWANGNEKPETMNNHNRTERKDDWITLAKGKIINCGDKLGQSISFTYQAESFSVKQMYARDIEPF